MKNILYYYFSQTLFSTVTFLTTYVDSMLRLNLYSFFDEQNLLLFCMFFHKFDLKRHNANTPIH